MNKVDKYILTIERVLLVVYSIILLLLILSFSNVFNNFSDISVILIFSMPLFISGLLPASFSVIVYYALLFIVPIIGLACADKKYIYLHISLLSVLVTILASHLYMYNYLLGL